MNLTPEEITKVATLARLSLTQEEAERHATTISSVLEYMTILNEVDTSQVEPTFQVTGLKEVRRPDAIVTSAPAEELRVAFPENQADNLVVPAVFE